MTIAKLLTTIAMAGAALLVLRLLSAHGKLGIADRRTRQRAGTITLRKNASTGAYEADDPQ